jgi:hypothetical protein
MTRTAEDLSLGGMATSGRLQWLSRQRIPDFLKRTLPCSIISGLRGLKGRILTRDFPRDVEFVQSREEAQASASISIVVAVHDAPRVSRRCFASLEKYASQSEVIIVDDASKLDETLDLIREFSERNSWSVIRHETPLGHSAACRIGASMATRPYLCLLNSDTVATPWCWQRVKEVFDDDKRVAVAGPSTSQGGTSQTLALAAELRSHWNDNQICVFAKRLLNECPEPVVMDLPWISGFAFFIRANLWEEFGGFDEKLADYGNEVELCSRIAQKGYRNVWVRTSYIHHFGGESYREQIGNEGILLRIRAAESYIRKKTRSSP